VATVYQGSRGGVVLPGIGGPSAPLVMMVDLVVLGPLVLWASLVDQGSQGLRA